jgi:ubiquinone/menaquinone biosynthesis C-methylase UbiE
MLLPLRVRYPGHELLDEPVLDPVDLRLNLREMARLNRLPGGVAASRRGIDRLLDGTMEATVLDVGTGSADLPAALVRKANGRAVRVLASDLRPEILAYARARVGRLESVEVLQADARDLPLTDDAVDVAHASLVMHHLDPNEAVAALREMRRVARLGVVINDLRRSPFAFAVTAVTVLALTRGRYTRHDGLLSARRAYTLAELDQLAAEAGLRPVWRSAPFLPRVVTVYR